MYLIYLDESGNTGTSLNDANQPLHIVVALIVHESMWQRLNERFRFVVRNQLATLLAQQQMFRQSPSLSALTEVELHAVDVYQGHGCFDGVPRENRERLIDEMLGMVSGDLHDDLDMSRLALAWSAVRKDRARWNKELQWTPGSCAFMIVAGLCARYLEAQSKDARGMFIADETPGAEADLQAYLKLFQRPPIWEESLPPFEEYPARLIEAIHFVDSRESAFIQMADFCAYFTNRAVRQEALSTDPYYARIADRVFAYRFWPVAEQT